MGIKNPIKNIKKSFKQLAKGKILAPTTTLLSTNKVTAKAAQIPRKQHDLHKKYGKKALGNPYVATAVAAAATAVTANPAVGAGVMAASGAIQAKQAMDQAKDAMKSIEAGFADPIEEAVNDSVSSAEDQMRRRRRRKDVGLSSLIRTGPRGLFSPAMNAMSATSNKLGA
jgi:glutaminase